ncbi:putative cation-transporting ATPase F [Methylobrevis pamukkalensis]|uniref:Putative cation-transporting ATPase F n=1 Tax=Methylobrevis pamukkalensis TaxID=1439726 RepID=A0A1E3H441_9HYPH|nr:putative cation-transporting ATPase F [Methylobrevis pamukkalensis]
MPADLRLVAADDLQCDESLLTGESVAVRKVATTPSDATSDPRRGAAFAGALVTRGRGRGVVSATGGATEVGRIARDLGRASLSRPPLMIRLERFSRQIAVAVGVALLLLVGVGLLRGMGLETLFMMAVGLAVSAIPEGLPVAISITLAIGMRRMAKANVIVRNLPAIEALGSCTLIATDKTGTLTLNELTVTDVVLPDGARYVFAAGRDGGLPVADPASPAGADAETALAALLHAAALPNDGRLVEDADGLHGIGDTVDVALLSAARRGGLNHEEVLDAHPSLARIPYEPDLRFAASFHAAPDAARRVRIFVKGAPETLIAMATGMDTGGRPAPIERDHLLRQKEEMAARGLRVLAFAQGEIEAEPDGDYGHRHLADLTFLGLAGMQDPVRPEVPGAIAACRRAGISVVMVTGDDPATAAAIGREAGLAFSDDEIATGGEVASAAAAGEAALDALARRARIYARVDPPQKLAIVLALSRIGHFVAVTGDGVNDAPALKHAHVGVAMGRKGTDVARESADLIVTDDHFASIVEASARAAPPMATSARWCSCWSRPALPRWCCSSSPCRSACRCRSCRCSCSGSTS